jgi:hypothetical protein
MSHSFVLQANGDSFCTSCGEIRAKGQASLAPCPTPAINNNYNSFTFYFMSHPSGAVGDPPSAGPVSVSPEAFASAFAALGTASTLSSLATQSDAPLSSSSAIFNATPAAETSSSASSHVLQRNAPLQQSKDSASRPNSSTQAAPLSDESSAISHPARQVWFLLWKINHIKQYRSAH